MKDLLRTGCGNFDYDSALSLAQCTERSLAGAGSCCSHSGILYIWKWLTRVLESGGVSVEGDVPVPQHECGESRKTPVIARLLARDTLDVATVNEHIYCFAASPL